MRRTYLVIVVVAMLCALHAHANPIDTDNDLVFDDFDRCPLQKGPA